MEVFKWTYIEDNQIYLKLLEVSDKKSDDPLLSFYQQSVFQK